MADKERQQQHAQNISAERHIMQQLGITRELARARLHDFREQQAADRVKAEAAKAPDPERKPPAKIEVDVTAFEPRPFTLDATVRKQSPSNESSAAGGEWYELELCDGTTLEVWARNITPP